MNPDLLTTARWHITNRSEMPWGDVVTAELLALINDKLSYPAPGTNESALVPIASLPAVDASQHIALCLGHGRAGDEGNVGAGGVSEEDYNLPVINLVAGWLREWGIRVSIYSLYKGNGYDSAMSWLAQQMLVDGITGAVEFHFNAYDKKAKGHEVLHWKDSVRGVTLAQSILDALDEAYPNRVSRGLKPKSPKDRGALFLSLPHCPCALVEPFFGDNPAEWAQFDETGERALLAKVIAGGIRSWIRTQWKGSAA